LLLTQKIIGDIRNKSDNINLLRSAYYLAKSHQSILQVISLHMEEKTFRIGEAVIDWNKTIDRMYIIKEGQVKLLRKKRQVFTEETQLTKGLEGGLTDIEQPPLIVPDLKAPKSYEEIGIRSAKQCFGEEYFFIKEPCGYRVCVTTEHASIIAIPFDKLEATLKKYDFYKEGTAGSRRAQRPHLDEARRRARLATAHRRQDVPVRAGPRARAAQGGRGEEPAGLRQAQAKHPREPAHRVPPAHPACRKTPSESSSSAKNSSSSANWTASTNTSRRSRSTSSSCG